MYAARGAVCCEEFDGAGWLLICRAECAECGAEQAWTYASGQRIDAMLPHKDNCKALPLLMPWEVTS